MKGFFALMTAACVGCALVLGINDVPTPIPGGVDGSFDGGVDAKTIDAHDEAIVFDAGVQCDASAPFKTIVAVSELNTAGAEGASRLTPDELTVYFYRQVFPSDGGPPNADIFTATRSSPSTPFGQPTPIVGSVNTAENESDPFLDVVSGIFYFSSNRAGNNDHFAIYSAEAPLFLNVQALSNTINTPNSQLVDTFFVNSTLWFARADGGLPITSLDIYSSPGFVPPQAVAELNVSASAFHRSAVVSANELVVYFATGTPANVYFSTRTAKGTPWNAPVAVGTLVSPSDTLPAWLSPNQCRLYFSRQTDAYSSDIFLATRTP